MKITVINGTEIKGCTYHIKESFLETLRDDNEITEFYLPKNLPHFCCGCKNCFLKRDKKMHQLFSGKEETLSADNQYWVDKGWVKH
jgi:multimeric flavodoxin WrbA